MADEILRVNQLHYVVQDGEQQFTLLNQIHFNVYSGESVAIVGASGSGKSTLLSMLAGLDTPTSGSIVLNGRDVTQMSEDERAQLRAHQIGFVFQTFQLLDHLSALENVMLAAQLSALPDKRQQCFDALARVGLSNRVHHTPKTLSGGEQQRVALARAFVRKPAIVFADEPTGSLDVATGEQVIEKMFELQQQANTTLILVTHDEGLASRCDRRLTVVQGSVTEQVVV